VDGATVAVGAGAAFDAVAVVATGAAVFRLAFHASATATTIAMSNAIL
jgi:hypothetical protein